jgi:hypothetical protein
VLAVQPSRTILYLKSGRHMRQEGTTGQAAGVIPTCPPRRSPALCTRHDGAVDLDEVKFPPSAAQDRDDIHEHHSAHHPGGAFQATFCALPFPGPLALSNGCHAGTVDGLDVLDKAESSP